jgi:hypothetical protein
MTDMIERWPFTKAIIAAVEGAGFPAAVAERPRLGGWQGDPNVSKYVPYAVLVPQTASSSMGPIGDPQGDWRLPYTLTTFTVMWDECERVADLVRKSLLTLVRASIASSGPSYRVVKVNLTTIGQVNRVDQTDPPFFTQTDAFEVWANKEPT